MTEQPAKNVVTGFMAKPRDTAADAMTGRLDGPSGPGRPVLVTNASYPNPRLSQPAAGVAGYPDLVDQLRHCQIRVMPLELTQIGVGGKEGRVAHTSSQ